MLFSMATTGKNQHIMNAFLKFSIKENQLKIYFIPKELNQSEFSATHFTNANDLYQEKNKNSDSKS